MSSTNYIGILIERMDSCSSSSSSSNAEEDACKLLKKLIHHVKSPNDIDAFRRLNGLSKLLNMLKDESFPTKELALSLLANCCIEETTILQILKWESIPFICNLLKTSQNEDIQYRVCRTIANLCRNDICCSIVHEDESTIKCIVACLGKCKEKNHIACYCKTIRILSKNKILIERMIGHRAVYYVGKSLNTELIDNTEQLKQILSGLYVFIKNWTTRVLDQLTESRALESVSKLLKSGNKEISQMAYSFVQKITVCEPLLKTFSSYGFLECFIKSFQATDNVNEKLRYFGYIIECSQHRCNTSTANISLLLKQMSDPLTKKFLTRTLDILMKLSLGCERFHQMFADSIIDTLTEILLKNASVGVVEYSKKLYQSSLQNAARQIYPTPLTPSDSCDELKSNSSYSNLNELNSENIDEMIKDDVKSPSIEMASKQKFPSYKLETEEKVKEIDTIEEERKMFFVEEESDQIVETETAETKMLAAAKETTKPKTSTTKCSRKRSIDESSDASSSSSSSLSTRMMCNTSSTRMRRNADDEDLYSFANQLQNDRVFMSRLHSIPLELVSLKSGKNSSCGSQKNVKRPRMENLNTINTVAHLGNSFEEMSPAHSNASSSCYNYYGSSIGSKVMRDRPVHQFYHTSILSFLTQFVRRTDWIKYFVNKEFIGTMVKCLIAYNKNVTIVQIFEKLCGISDYFLLLITEMFPSAFHLQYLDSDIDDQFVVSSQPKRISDDTYKNVLQILTNSLNRCHFRYLLDDSKSKKKAIISLAYLTSDRYKMTKSLVHDTILKTLLEIMYDDQDEYQTLATLAYVHIVRQSKAQITDCIMNNSKTASKTHTKAEMISPGSVTKDISFHFDDGQIVQSNKDILSRNSDVFRTMFQGSYIESSSLLIKLPETSRKIFAIFNDGILSESTEFLQKNFDETDVIIGIFKLAHKYMVTAIEERAIEIIKNNLDSYFDEILNTHTLLNSTSLTFHCIVHACRQRFNSVSGCHIVHEIRRYITFSDLLKYSNMLYDEFR